MDLVGGPGFTYHDKEMFRGTRYTADTSLPRIIFSDSIRDESKCLNMIELDLERSSVFVWQPM